MRVLLDGKLVPIDRPTLAVAIATAARAAEASGRVIISALADGKPIPDDVLQQPPDEFSSIGEVTLTTASPTRVVAEMLTHAADALGGVRASQREAGEAVQRGDLAIQESLESIFTVWQAVAGGVQQAAEMLSLDLAQLRVPDGLGDTIAVSPQIEILVERLRDLQSALKRQDWSAVADALLFDLQELAKDWETMLRGLALVIAPPDNLSGTQPGGRA